MSSDAKRRAHKKQERDKREKGKGENQDQQPSCLEKVCPCIRSSSPSRKQDHQPSFGKITMSEKQQNGQNIYKNGGQSMENSSPKTIVESRNGQAFHKDMENVMKEDKKQVENVSTSREKQRPVVNQDRRDGSLGDKRVTPPGRNISSTVANQIFSEEQRKGTEISNLLNDEQKKSNSPMETVGSLEASQLLPEEQQKIDPPRKIVSSTEAEAKPPKKSVGSLEESQLLLKEQQKIDPPRKIVSRTEADNKLLKEQKEIDPLKKNASGGEAWQLTSKEKQIGDVKKETSYGITAARVNNRTSGHPLEDDRKVIPKQENNENYTKKTFGGAEQEDLPFWKQKQKCQARGNQQG